MKLRSTALIVFTMLVSAGIVFAGGQRQSGGLTTEKGILTIGMEIGYPPMEYLAEDGKTPIGFDVDMAKALGAKLGLEVKFIDTAWDGIFAGVDTGKYDCIISSVTITPERLAAHNFTKPYIGNAQSIVVLKNSSIKVGSPEDLEGLGVAYQAETTSDTYMAQFAEKGLQFTPYEYDKVMNCFDELKLNRVDAIICDSLVSVDYIAPPDSPFEIVWQGPATETFGICLKKGNDALTQALDKALDELFADGTMLKISQNTFKMDLVSGVR
ncbi:MAG: transporter substrate-binding domain-containing protein [Treponema sp.]|nr:transporter substrate-binding domain-containing protein [Treponema sp.]